MVGAKVDGKIVPINHEVKTGEVIEILTTNQAGHGPSRDWLNIAVTSSAKAKIRSWFKKEKRSENIATGKADFEKELRRNNIDINDDELEAYVEDLARRHRLQNGEEFYAAIGYGGILLSKIIPRVKDDLNKKAAEKKQPEIVPINEIRSKKSSDGVIVEGVDNCLIKFSHCCNPLPGDDIIGYITRGHGVSIHKRDCNNVPVNIADSPEPARWITAYWDGSKSESFTSTLRATAIDRQGILIEIMNAVNNMRVPIHSISARQLKNGNCTVILTISAESVEHLNSIIMRIEKVSGIFSVERINQ